jgi:hypothetical protein
MEDPVAKRAMSDSLRHFDLSPDMLIILTHDASLLDVVEFFPEAGPPWSSRLIRPSCPRLACPCPSPRALLLTYTSWPL